MWAWAQMRPYTLSYASTDYNASNQNWGTIKDKKGVMYFANNSGVLVFDGSNWNIIKANAAVKSLAIDTAENKIYVGAKGDFGMLVNNEVGTYEFKSLKHLIPEENRNFADIWSILIDPNEGVIFEAISALYIFKDDTINVVKPSKGFQTIFSVDGHVYVSQSIIGIQELKNGELIEAKNLEEAGSKIVFMDKVDGKLSILNSEKGPYIEDGDSLIHQDFPLGSKLLNNDIYRVAKTSEGNYILGTLSHGLFVTDNHYNLIKHVDIADRIYSVYEDDNKFIWVTTNTLGIIILDMSSPCSWFPNKVTGITGLVRSITSNGKELYLGADAIFHINLDSLDNPKFEQISYPGGVMSFWKLDTIQGKIVGGGEKGLFTIDTNNVLYSAISSNQSRLVRNFVVPKDNPNVLIGCSSQGFSKYEKRNGKWTYSKPIEGFNEIVRQFYEDTDGYFWSSAGKEVCRIRFNQVYDSVVSFTKYDSKHGLPANTNNYVFNTGDRIVVGTLDGIYKYDCDSDKFVEDVNLNTAFGGKKVFDLMYHDGLGNIWARHVTSNKRDKNIQYWFLERYAMRGDSSAVFTDDIFRPYMSQINSFGYIGNGRYVIGVTDGFVLYDENVVKDTKHPYNALIRTIENIYSDSLIFGGNETDKKIVLPYELRSVRVQFAATCYEHPENIRFKSYLEGNDDTWSDFRSENYKEYPNLSPGTYTLHVIASNIYNVESREATITFVILPPWYLTIWAKIFYGVLFALAIWLFVKAYTKKLIRDKEKLEQIVLERTAEIRKQSQLIMEKNEEITAKNKEITDSIRYAQRIQTAMLPMEERIKSALPDHFILFRPKDIVSGDYYWYAETDQSIIITAADCTGHGVPGAFMSMIGSQILTEIVVDGITSPEQILTNQNRRIRKALKQDTTANQDGMDMALCCIDKKTHLVEYSGAKNQLVVIQNNELTEYKADKQSIGGQQLYGDDFQYKKVAIQPDGNTWFYMFSDGYKDQFGGPNNTKFLIKNLRALLMQIHNEPPAKQREILNDTIEKWIKDGGTEQTDDIIIIGFKC